MIVCYPPTSWLSRSRQDRRPARRAVPGRRARRPRRLAHRAVARPPSPPPPSLPPSSPALDAATPPCPPPQRALGLRPKAAAAGDQVCRHLLRPDGVVGLPLPSPVRCPKELWGRIRGRRAPQEAGLSRSCPQPPHTYF